MFETLIAIFTILVYWLKIKTLFLCGHLKLWLPDKSKKFVICKLFYLHFSLDILMKLTAKVDTRLKINLQPQ